MSEKSRKKGIILGVLLCFVLTGCCMSHEWQDATCTVPKTCSKCGETEGETLEHVWIDATCTAPKTCSKCGGTEGEALEHTLTEANYQSPAICTVCNNAVGEPLKAYFEEQGFSCGELRKEYPYLTTCNDSDKTTVGTIRFHSIEIEDYLSRHVCGEDYEAKDGYEWRLATFYLKFDDENAQKLGASWALSSASYYEKPGVSSSDEGGEFTINYNGKDYTECYEKFNELRGKWFREGNHLYFEAVYQYICRVPVGYDGMVVVAYNRSNYDAAVAEKGEDNVTISDLIDEDSVMFRVKYMF